MIGVPFDNNDLSCLGAITEIVAEMVARREPLLAELAMKHPTTEALAAWIRTLPQRDDEGIRSDGPKVAACTPVQRLRIPAPDPNCVERSALYLGVAELLDPGPVRQLATLDLEWGRHTFVIEAGAPVVLDPVTSPEAVTHALAAQTRNGLTVPVTAPAVPAMARVAIDVSDALEYTAQLGEAGAAAVRNGPSRAQHAREALRGLVREGALPADERALDDLGWFFAQAEAEAAARSHGARALAIVRTTALAIADLIDDVIAQRTGPQRNLSFEVGGTSFRVPSWVTDLGGVVGRIGLDLGAMALAPKLAALGVTGPMLKLVEEELNAEGLTLGPLAKPGTSLAAATGRLGRLAG